ncbi:hypothetical protein AK830_g2607 [Neonectria ditissima]|uniref:Ketoreductase (KR) domain-containing protein n=1 Tax=Neonectria ditissima TaxID=78410 RepID=A0A0P7BEL1_9HYPO|nr:hypothetical protein AK830_g2607 [Neonectria ditissima]
MPGFLSFVRAQYTALPLPQPPANIADGTYVVTGANTGLGFECTKHLFQMGAGRIILAVRSRGKGDAALATIRTETGRHEAGEVWELDLMSLDSVEKFAKKLETLDRLDALISNAGAVMAQFQVVEGIEVSLLVNVVSTMLLTFRALPKLQESAKKFGIQPRLVIVTSNSALDNDMKSTVETLQGDVFDALSTEKGFGIFTHNVLPAWITNETGKRTQKRVWVDLLKRLDSTGHGVDMSALKTG